jgi:hypothetical protein
MRARAMSREPVRTVSLYEAGHRLFSSHPLAARDVNLAGTIRAMVLMVCDGGQAWFFVLSQGCGYEGKIDIEGRFRRPAVRDGWPRAGA